ncbi:hypothetical protein [Nostoc sp. LPT]|uniref:hypothetical protein n=1 Tax=Nostoc sp. LPT TaxID=2815387 RepID=UPI001D524CE6|nr:hypothetical protein [Nostoc sp. LPT]MBN4005951.1 hypothetical protein [Nostoc sp. LPT]
MPDLKEVAWEPPFGFGGNAPSPKGRRYANLANAALTHTLREGVLPTTGTAKTATPSPQRAGSLIASVQELGCVTF